MTKPHKTSGMPYALQSDGEARALGATKFTKELLAEGSFQHPVRPWNEPLVVDEAYIDSLVETTNTGFEQGVKVPLPLGHNDGDDPEKNRGFMTRAYKDVNERGQVALFGEIEVTNPDAAERMGRDLKDVSVYIDKWGSGQWTPEGDRIVHVALTNYPVYAGQDNFQRLSADGTSTVPVLRREVADPEENTMKLSAEQREALAGRGVTLDGDEPTVEDGLTALLSVEVTEPVEPTANDVPHLLSVDADAERYFSAWHKAEADKVEAEIKVACEDGRLSADMAEAVKTLLGVSQGYSLSAEGKAEAVDVPALVRTILSAIPAKAVVPVGEEVTAAAAGNDPGAHPPVEVKEFGPADVAETVKRMAARVPEVK